MVIVSALPTDELLSVGLGQLMAARAFLRGIRRVCFDYHYAAQSGLVQNELEQLIERPLRLFGVAANLSLSNVLQFFQHNAPTMFCGVVHDLFGHHVIFVLCASALLVANLVEQTPLRSEEHTSELQSHSDLVCRLLLEKKKKIKNTFTVGCNYACNMHTVDTRS